MHGTMASLVEGNSRLMLLTVAKSVELMFQSGASMPSSILNYSVIKFEIHYLAIQHHPTVIKFHNRNWIS